MAALCTLQHAAGSGAARAQVRANACQEQVAMTVW